MREVNVRTIEQRVGLIVYMIQKRRAEPEIRAVASKILSQKCGAEWCIPEKDWTAEVSAIFYWLRHNVRYTLDPYSRDMFQSPLRALEFQTVDCDDQTILAGAILQSVGYPLHIVIIDTGKGGWSHIYLHVGIPPMNPRRWIPFDLTNTKAPLGWEMPAGLVHRKRIFEVE